MSFLTSFLKADASRPADNELEISVFGAGIGECIVVHLAAGQWLVVDSFLSRESGRPVAIEYLDAIGVDVTKQVHQIIVTHWHDDHIRGASALFNACVKADMVCSNALCSREFLQLMALHRSHGAVLAALTTGTDEFQSLFATAMNRQKESGRLPMQFATASKKLFVHRSDAVACSVTSLSPSDAEYLRALNSFARLFPDKAGEAKTRLPDVQPNDTAVVLWLTAGDLSVLLGSDLETAHASDMGWTNILLSKTRPEGRAAIFKIPHHGSRTGYDERVWKELLIEAPHAILTPFTRSSLPKDTEIACILSHTSHAYGAGDNIAKKPKRESKVEKVFKEKTKTRRTIDGKLGLVRFRVDTKTKAQKVELFGNACHLSAMLSRDVTAADLAATGT